MPKTPTPPNRRRDKPQLSCNPCRRKKRQCDRGRPCGRCVKLDDVVNCTYAQTKDGPIRKNDHEVLENVSPTLSQGGYPPELRYDLQEGIGPVTFTEGFTKASTAGSPHELPNGSFGQLSRVGSWLSTITKETNCLDELSETQINQERHRASIVAATECFGKIARPEGEKQPQTYHSIFKFPI